MAMRIGRGKVVSFHYKSRNEGGVEIDNSHDGPPMIYLHGYRGILSGLEVSLRGREAGETYTVELPPAAAYGERTDNANQRIPIKHLSQRPKKLAVGSVVKFNTRQGERDATVLKVGRFNVDVDTNHPYAGQTITFEVEVLAVREAEQVELAHGHAHRMATDPS